MAKTKMLCPFLGGICKECAFYRGRHYYLCFCPKYRGYIDEPENDSGHLMSGYKPGKFEWPAALSVKAFDPFALPQKDIK